MINLADLIDAVSFEPEKIYLSDGEKTIRVDYRLLVDKFSYPLNCFLELVPVEGHVFFSNHVWKNENDVYCDTSLLELLKQAEETYYGEKDQKISKYLLMVQNALTDLRFGDEDGIMELVSLIESSEEIQKA